MKVAYLTGKSFATSSNGPALCRAFNACNVRTISANDLDPAELKEIDFLMLPGITGETSPYPSILPPEKARILYEKIEDGLIVMAECAAFYWTANHIHYNASDGRKLERQGLGWIDGVARGPSGKGIAPNDEFRYADTTTTMIEFYDGRETCYTPICISNGPALYLSDTEEKNPDVTITSRFVNEIGKPVATMTKMIGNGMLVGMGVLPHIQAEQLGGKRLNPGFERHRVELFNAISAHEEKIIRFEKLIFDQIKSHHSTLQSQSGEMPYVRVA